MVSRASRFGLLESSGNHCDLRVVLVLLTHLSAAEVVAHYRAPGIRERLAPSRRGLARVTVEAEGGRG